MKISRGIFCQDIVDDERPRVGSKKSVQQGRSHFCARSVLVLRERSRREERQVCEPEGPENSENAADGFFNRPIRIAMYRGRRQPVGVVL